MTNDEEILQYHIEKTISPEDEVEQIILTPEDRIELTSRLHKLLDEIGDCEISEEQMYQLCLNCYRTMKEEQIDLSSKETPSVCVPTIQHIDYNPSCVYRRACPSVDYIIVPLEPAMSKIKEARDNEQNKSE